MPTKEGGWGWVIVLSSFMIHLVTCGISYSSGAIYQSVLQSFDGNVLQASAIGALLLGFTALSGLPATLITYRFGFRACIICGGLLSTFGFGMAGAATRLYHLYLTIGVIAGIGFGLSLTPSIMIIDTYFLKKRDLAASVAISGVGVGVFLFPLLIYKMDEQFAWKGMMFTLAGICLTIAVFGLAMKPSYPGAIKHRELLDVCDVSLLTSLPFVVLCASNLLWSLGISAIYVHLPGYVLSTGVGLEDALVLVAVTGVASFTSRSCFMVFSHASKLDNVSTFLCTIGLTSVLTGLFPELFSHKAGQFGYAIMLGLHTGYWTTFIAYVAGELIGDQYLARGKGLVTMSVTMGLMSGPLLAGWVIDMVPPEDAYEIVFYAAGACLLAASAAMVMINMKGCYHRPGDDYSVYTNDTDSTVTVSSYTQYSYTPYSCYSWHDDEQLLVTCKLTTV